MPEWLAADWQQRGVKLTVAYQADPKAHHGRRERTVKGVTTVETGYGITSVDRRKGGAHRFLRLNREYWGIENGLHWVRDVTFDEDRSQVRSGAAPQVCAGLRSLGIALLRRVGATNIAAALRTCSARPRQAAALVLSARSE